MKQGMQFARIVAKKSSNDCISGERRKENDTKVFLYALERRNLPLEWIFMC